MPGKVQTHGDQKTNLIEKLPEFKWVNIENGHGLQPRNVHVFTTNVHGFQTTDSQM